jgi:hypothetical protein
VATGSASEPTSTHELPSAMLADAEDDGLADADAEVDAEGDADADAEGLADAEG